METPATYSRPVCGSTPSGVRVLHRGDPPDLARLRRGHVVGDDLVGSRGRHLEPVARRVVGDAVGPAGLGDRATSTRLRQWLEDDHRVAARVGGDHASVPVGHHVRRAGTGRRRPDDASGARRRRWSGRSCGRRPCPSTSPTGAIPAGWTPSVKTLTISSPRTAETVPPQLVGGEDRPVGGLGDVVGNGADDDRRCGPCPRAGRRGPAALALSTGTSTGPPGAASWRCRTNPGSGVRPRTSPVSALSRTSSFGLRLATATVRVTGSTTTPSGAAPTGHAAGTARSAAGADAARPAAAGSRPAGACPRWARRAAGTRWSSVSWRLHSTSPLSAARGFGLPHCCSLRAAAPKREATDTSCRRSTPGPAPPTRLGARRKKFDTRRSGAWLGRVKRGNLQPTMTRTAAGRCTRWPD